MWPLTAVCNCDVYCVWYVCVVLCVACVCVVVYYVLCNENSIWPLCVCVWLAVINWLLTDLCVHDPSMCYYWCDGSWPDLAIDSDIPVWPIEFCVCELIILLLLLLFDCQLTICIPLWKAVLCVNTVVCVLLVTWYCVNNYWGNVCGRVCVCAVWKLAWQQCVCVWQYYCCADWPSIDIVVCDWHLWLPASKLCACAMLTPVCVCNDNV